ncbi:hypothetical protein D3C76_1821240 [compost metagenome]
MTVEQRASERFLERADLAADGRLGQVQNIPRMGQRPRVGDGMEYSKLVPIHDNAFV